MQLLDLTGKPMVLHFWATWCGICDEEMPDWESLYQEFGDQVTFVMVDVVDGVDETVEKGKAYLEENGYQIARVAMERNGSILPKASFAETMLEDGDTLEIVSFVGGG